jgi:hypothetical protein
MKSKLDHVALTRVLDEHDPLRAYMGLVDIYLECDEVGQTFIRHNWEFNREWRLSPRYRFACRTGEVYSSQHRIIAFLVYCDIARDWKQVGDVRDLICDLAVAYNGCKLAGSDPEAIFAWTGERVSEELKVHLIDFVNRAESDKAMVAFQLSTITNADGETELRSSRWVLPE